MLLIRERPPLRLGVNIETPGGLYARWTSDDPNPANKPQALQFASAIPGGFASMSCTLQRDPRLAYPDLEELQDVTVRGAGGEIAWQGRLEQAPDTGGAQAQVTPTCAGWQNHLKDNPNARQIFLDAQLSAWQGASVQRQSNLLSLSIDETDASSSTDATTGEPALVTQITGDWSRESASEGWYDAKGLTLGGLYYAFKAGASIGTADTNWDWQAYLSSNDVAGSLDASGGLRAATGQGFLASTGGKQWAVLQQAYAVAGGAAGVNYPVYWTYLGVVGNHGLPIQGTLTATGGLGVLASDVIAYALSQWAPKLAYTTGAGGTIQPSSFAIDQLVFRDPTTVADMIAQAIQYEMLDWAVWEGPTFYLNPFGQSVKTRHWRARVGAAQLQETGPDITRLVNGVVVQFTDVTGVTRTVGPPGSACNYTSSLLVDSDPQNPANQAGITKWGLLQMGTTGLGAGGQPDAAIQVGAIYLTTQRTVNTSGQASLVGHVQDDRGVWWPAWSVRAGDYIAFTDASDSAYRRIVSTSYDDATKTNAIQLDQPPATMQAVLARLSEVVAPLGFS